MTQTQFIYAKVLAEHYAETLCQLRRKIDYMGPHDPQRSPLLDEQNKVEAKLLHLAGLSQEPEIPSFKLRAVR